MNDDARNLADRLDEIARHCASLPMRRRRTEDEILGYDTRGIPDRGYDKLPD